ncbi:MAG TPA: glycosyltransferase family 2 protein [Chthoniobacterales bacterium]|jgi:glycosyltransferase involved in cell wall biosynthesis|nr:glycosyltransferase family 2 protein [Chthoniobacterales bacterium]
MESAAPHPGRPLDRTNVAAVIPAYHEEAHVRGVAERARAQLDRVAVIDDGSSDATAVRAREAGAEVIVHPQNRGKGEAIKTGLRHWLARSEIEFIFIFDADGQHLPEEIGRFLNAAAATESGLFIGTRMNDVRGMPFVRRTVNRYMSRRISRLCGQEVPDTQCGYRMVHRALVPHLLAGTSRFDYETEMLIIASRQGCRIASVPISTIYSDEVSSIHPVRDTIRFFKLMRRYEKELSRRA